MSALPKRIASIRMLVAFASIGLASTSGCGQGGSGQGANATWTFGLGDLAAETNYFVTFDNGAITMNSDPAGPDATVLYLDLGERYLAVNYILLNAYSPLLRTFMLAHAIGRFYRGDPGIVTGLSYLSEEWLADAYATRVLYAQWGASLMQDCILEMAALGEAGDANHPGSAQRAGYMQTILGAVVADERSVPAPPGMTNELPQFGGLVFSDVTGDMTDAIVDNMPAGGTLPRGSVFLVMTRGNHVVGLYDEITGLLYWAAKVTISNGKTTYTPF